MHWNEGPAQAIRDAIGEAEKQVDAEFACAVAPRSSRYLAWRLGWAVGFSWAVSLALFHFLPEATPLTVLLLQAPLVLAAVLLTGFGPLLRAVVPDWAEEQAVESRAKEAFVDLGVGRTHGRNGVLLFVSQLERRVFIVADSQVTQRSGPGVVAQAAKQWGATVRSAGLEQGTVAFIQAFSAALAKTHPAVGTPRDQLSNEVVRLG